MKRHLIAFILAAFAGTVVYLLSLSIGLAISRFFLNAEFQSFKSNMGFIDFISGADVFFCIVLFFLYTFFSGIFYRVQNSSNRTIQIKQISLSIFVMICVEFLIGYRSQLTIVTEFHRIHYVLFFVGILFYLKNLETTLDGIDKVFSSFKPALIIGSVIFFVFWIINGFEIDIFSTLKLLFLLILATFIHLLSCYVLFSSFYKIEEK